MVDWQKGGNIQKTFEVLKVMAKKYGAQEYVDVRLNLSMNLYHGKTRKYAGILHPFDIMNWSS